MKHEAHRGIDAAVHGLAPRAQQHGRVSHGPAGDPGHASAVLGPEVHLLPRRRQTRRVVADCRVAALELDHLAELGQTGPGAQRVPHLRARGLHRRRDAGEREHPGRQLDG